ncbi:aflatoxin biosynthesis ketoreductase nor-1 [Mycena crocata]|nr:aflatoxin biosynthesis ketoreductase nor-1 [Mycena crocata]
MWNHTHREFQVTGANRGIGYGIVVALAARENAVVFAAARDPSAQSLKDLSTKHPNTNCLLGVAKYVGPLATTPLSEFRDHWEVNTLGTVVLFQAAQKLLLASPTGAPIFAYISSGAGSIGRYFGIQTSAYGSSKAAANFLIKALDAENPSLIAFALSPGWVATDMGNFGAKAAGLAEAPFKVGDVIEGIMSRIDGAVEKSSGRFWNFIATFGGMPWDLDAEEVPW